jgi:hypothetical protein
MRNPALAVLWESWRLTRRRLLFFPSLITLCSLMLSLRSVRGTPAFVLMTLAAIAMAFAMPMFGTGPGFPLSKAFPRPIHTAVLVAVPLGYVGAAAAACYLVPVALLGVLTGEPFPLVSLATLIGTLAVLAAGSAWFSRRTATRIAAAVAAYFVAGVMYKLLDPFREAGSFPLAVDPRLCQLSGAGYLEVALFIGCIYLALLWAVERQRRGDDETTLPHSDVDASRARRGDILTWVRNTCVEWVRWRCPVSSPIAAEVWFELQYYGMAVLAIGAVLALCVPMLLSLGNAHRSGIPLAFAASTLLAPLMAGVGASIWNRQRSARVCVSAFVASRPVGTANLVGLQVLITTGCVAAAWILISVSLWASLPLLRDMYHVESPVALAADIVKKYGLRLVSGATVCFILLATLFALLVTVRALVSSYGWRLWSGALGLALYAIGVALAVAQGWIGEAVVSAHLWTIAVAIPVGTLFVFRRVVASRILTPGQAIGVSLAWLVFAALCVDMLRLSGMLELSPALTALVLASMAMPLSAAVLAPWSVSLVRHA